MFPSYLSFEDQVHCRKLGSQPILEFLELLKIPCFLSFLIVRCETYSNEETLFRRFRDCPASLVIWGCLKIRNHGQFFGGSNWTSWLKGNLCGKATRGEESNWSIVFGVTLELMWRNQNDFIFSQKSYTTHSSIVKIRYQVDGIVDCMQRKSTLNPQIRSFTGNDSFNWNSPPPNFLKLNCDGPVRDNGRSAGCGGVVRDEHSSFILAFTPCLHNCNSLEAELQGILNGLQIVWSRNFTNIVVDSDSVEALELIANGIHREPNIHRLVAEILKVGWWWRIECEVEESGKTQQSCGRQVNQIEP